MSVTQAGCLKQLLPSAGSGEATQCRVARQQHRVLQSCRAAAPEAALTSTQPPSACATESRSACRGIDAPATLKQSRCEGPPARRCSTCRRSGRQALRPLPRSRPRRAILDLPANQSRCARRARPSLSGPQALRPLPRSRPRRALLDLPVHGVLLHVLVVLFQLQALRRVFPVLRSPRTAPLSDRRPAPGATRLLQHATEHFDLSVLRHATSSGKLLLPDRTK